MQSEAQSTILIKFTHPANTKDPPVEMQVGGRGKAILLDLTHNNSTVLTPETKTYFQAPLRDLQPSELYLIYAFLQPKTPGSVCDEWMLRPHGEGESCRNLGHEIVNGRDTVKYKSTCSREVCHLWVDSELRVLLKRQTRWTSTELRNIREEKQSSELFEVPAGYTKSYFQGVIRASKPE
jgi:hypothetical protein